MTSMCSDGQDIYYELHAEPRDAIYPCDDLCDGNKPLKGYLEHLIKVRRSVPSVGLIDEIVDQYATIADLPR